MAVKEMLDFTREYFRVPVTLSVNGVNIDPTTLAIEFAVVLTGVKPTNEWTAGTWETAGSEYRAMTLVGPTGDVTVDFEIVAPNLYDVYWRITDNPERPARMVGQIQAT